MMSAFALRGLLGQEFYGFLEPIFAKKLAGQVSEQSYTDNALTADARSAN